MPKFHFCYITGIKAHKCVICLRNFSTMGNLGAHVKSVHHLPFSKKIYQEGLKAAQAAEQNNPESAGQEQPGGGPLPLSEESSLPAQATPVGVGTTTGTVSSLQQTAAPSPAANASDIIYDKKALLEHYRKKYYQESAPRSNLPPIGDVSGSTPHNQETNQDINRPSPLGVQSSQLLVTGTAVTNQVNNTQEVRATAPPVLAAPSPSSTASIQTHPVPPNMVQNIHDLARYQDMFTATHPQHMVAHPQDISYATATGNLPLPLYRSPTGPLQGNPM